MNEEPIFSQADGPALARAPAYTKRPNQIHLKRIDGPFFVDTHEGRMHCDDGYVAHDPMTGHVWAVCADYAELHYEPISPM